MIDNRNSSAKVRTQQDDLQDAEAGSSLIEVMITMTVVTFSLLGLSSVIASNHAMQVSTNEQVAAHNATVDALERLRSGGLSTAYDQYIALATVPKNPITETMADSKKPDVSIEFPEAVLAAGLDPAAKLAVDSGYQPANLAVTSKASSVLKYTDTDGDGIVDREDSRDDSAALVPVRVRVQWRDSKGRMRQTTTTTMVTQK